LSDVLGSARTADTLRFLISEVTFGFLALKLAFRTRAGLGFGTAPITLCLLTKRSAIGFGSDAGGSALSWGAHGFALRTVILLAHVLGTTNTAFRLLAVDGALGACSLLALHFAFWPSANWMALSWADWIITLPSTLGMTFGLSCQDGTNAKGNDKKKNGFHG